MQPHERLIAPGHVFLPSLRTGIEWTPETARLWNRGALLGEASHSTHSPYEFWYELAFAECFPQVEKWWFHSMWSGQVIFGAPEFADNGAVWGKVQYQGEQPSLYWIETTSPAIVEVPLPVSANYPANLPLRVAVARLAYGVITEDAVADMPYTVSSLVKREDLAKLFSTFYEAPGLNFVLSEIAVPLRQQLCSVMGLHPDRMPISVPA